ncbi:MAG TPA: serine hydrolase domain-containing protein [Candidatus Paceibacterota bacterium]|nr:serine hydrolase domain-containing protein [Verrucomicrobiota bacterium]HRY48983.1 serine hydrolase domain-containing protein [Candidatus Paceibacterota bacterium]HSA00791.1 serine hydrolase domain-containing protein [Candidatus Paceibacterota bacterium]
MKRIAPILLSISMLAESAALSTTNTGTRLGQTLVELRQKYNIVGLSVAGLHRGRLVWQTNLGFANLERQEPVTDRTKFRIASVSKLITAVALMQLWEAGRFQLDDSISDYLGFPIANPHHPDKAITFRHLLTHTAGFADGQAYDDFLAQASNEISLRELLCPGGRFYRDGAVYAAHAPGGNYCYSNLGFALAGTLVEKISGDRFDLYCASHLFKPLGMNASFNPATLPAPIEIATLYRFTDNKWIPQFDNYQGKVPTNRLGVSYGIGRNALPCAPQGGLRANVGDLARFAEVFARRGQNESDGVLKSATIALMLGRDEQGGTSQATLAFQRHTNLVKGETWIGHTGSAYGLYSLLFFQEDGPHGVILLTNGSRPGEEHDGFSPMEREIVHAVHAGLTAREKESDLGPVEP